MVLPKRRCYKVNPLLKLSYHTGIVEGIPYDLDNLFLGTSWISISHESYASICYLF